MNATDYEQRATDEFIRIVCATREEYQRTIEELRRRGALNWKSLTSFESMQPDLTHYSLARAIKCAKENNPSGLEAEMHQQLASMLDFKPKGFLVPIKALAASAPTGGFTIGQTVPTVAEALRPASIALSLGATMIQVRPDVKVPSIGAGTEAFWLAETEECPETSLELGALTLTPHRCAAWLKASNQLLIQTPDIADAVLGQDLRAAVGSALDLAVFSGAGGAEPLGLLNNEDVLSGAFGGAATRTKLAEFERLLGDENADDLSAVWVTGPLVREKWRNIPDALSYLWGDNNQVLGHPARSSKNVADNRVILGVFSDLLIVNWGVMEFITDPFTSKRSAQTELLVNLHADAGPVRAKSFLVSTDSGAQ
jgi:HK97 family phage major capsid protein